MTEPLRKEICDIAISIIQSHLDGIRTQPLLNAIADRKPNSDQSVEKWKNTIHGFIWNLDDSFPDKIKKPGRGLYAPVIANEADAAPVRGPVGKYREQDFYESFAQYLKNDLEEATDAVVLGAAGGGKWGTPDVVGVYRLPRNAVINIQTEIIAGELKTNPDEYITAFGQAVAYRLFATTSYIAMPITISLEDKSRLETLCMLHGIGLVLFTTDFSKPDFKISVRAQRGSPDMFYANEFVERLRKRDISLFNQLFG